MYSPASDASHNADPNKGNRGHSSATTASTPALTATSGTPLAYSQAHGTPHTEAPPHSVGAYAAPDPTQDTAAASDGNASSDDGFPKEGAPEKEAPHANEKTFKNLYVRLPKKISHADFAALFAPFNARGATIMADARTGESKGFGFVQFDTEDEGKLAHQTYNRKTVLIGTHRFELRTVPSKHQPVDLVPTPCLYVRNVPNTVTKPEVEALLERFGSVVFCAMRGEPEGLPVWVILVEYDCQQCADNALSHLRHNTTLFKRSAPVIAKYAKPMERKRHEPKANAVPCPCKPQQHLQLLPQLAGAMVAPSLVTSPAFVMGGGILPNPAIAQPMPQPPVYVQQGGAPSFVQATFAAAQPPLLGTPANVFYQQQHQQQPSAMILGNVTQNLGVLQQQQVFPNNATNNGAMAYPPIYGLGSNPLANANVTIAGNAMMLSGGIPQQQQQQQQTFGSVQMAGGFAPQYPLQQQGGQVTNGGFVPNGSNNFNAMGAPNTTHNLPAYNSTMQQPQQGFVQRQQAQFVLQQQLQQGGRY